EFNFGFWISDFGFQTRHLRVLPVPRPIQNPKSKIQNCSHTGAARMTLISIAWKSIRQRWLSSSLTALSVALGVALMVTVLVIHGVVSRMFSQSATGYHLVVGAKGSPMQLVLNTIYFMD